jgi:phage gpG-like protein
MPEPIFEINAETDKIISRIKSRIERTQPKNPALLRSLHRVGLLISNQAKLNIRTRKLIDFGHLLNSIFYKIQDTANGPELLVGSFGIPYARIHEFGGIIRPVRARALAIPLRKEFRNIPPRTLDLFVLKRGGKVFLARKNGGKLDILYVLKDQVRIPARPYLRPALVRHREKILDILAEGFISQ